MSKDNAVEKLCKGISTLFFRIRRGCIDRNVQAVNLKPKIIRLTTYDSFVDLHILNEIQ